MIFKLLFRLKLILCVFLLIIYFFVRGLEWVSCMRFCWFICVVIWMWGIVRG